MNKLLLLLLLLSKVRLATPCRNPHTAREMKRLEIIANSNWLYQTFYNVGVPWSNSLS